MLLLLHPQLRLPTHKSSKLQLVEKIIHLVVIHFVVQLWSYAFNVADMLNKHKHLERLALVMPTWPVGSGMRSHKMYDKVIMHILKNGREWLLS